MMERVTRTMSAFSVDEMEYRSKGPGADMADYSASEGETSDESDVDDDDDDGQSRVTRTTAKDLLDKILAAIATGTGQGTFATFRSEHDRLTDPTGDPWSDQKNALHFLARPENTLPADKDDELEPLVKFLVEHKDNLLAKVDRHGCTPLYYAVENKRKNMVRWMCKYHKDIGAVLSVVDKDQQNCIHAAIKKRVKFLKLLVEAANETALAAKDKDGNTPLHLAVDYRMCREGQLAIVELIVEKSDDAVKSTPNGDLNNAGQSPFLYHRASRREATEKRLAKERKAREGADSKRRPDAGQEPSSAKSMRPPAPVAPGPDAGLDINGPAPLANSGSAYRPRTTRPENDRSKFGEPGLPTANARQDAVPGRASTASAKPASDKKSETSSRSRVDEATVKSIERFLKLHYLRSRSNDRCIEVLYGLNTPPDLELVFELNGSRSTTIKQREFDNLLSRLKFADMLQYVAIPDVRIELKAVTGPNTGRMRGGARAGRFDGAGRSDFAYVFDRLRAKGVTTVLKVEVKDTSNPPHSEEAIEAALGGLGVEIWDWKRVDLCTEVIVSVAPNAREVHLYWSGNNAVARGWAEEGGLKKLPHLREVHVSVERGLESAARTQRHFEEFKSRMEKLCPRVKIIREDDSLPKRRPGSASALRAAGEENKQKTQHEWVQCMTDFRRLLFDAESSYDRLAEAEKRRTLSESMDSPIRVALIDDGVDFKDLEYTFIGGRTFCTRDELNNLIHPYYVSRAGHGTQMARYIWSMCPATQFYVLRLEDHTDPDDLGTGARQITAKSAAQAIRAAVRMKVHIISMSWVIEASDDDAADVQELRSAIVEAANEGILMFCAANDRGAKQTATYPRKATERIFTCGAASAWGTASDWVGDLGTIDFMFPGDKVELPGAGESMADIKTPSGSSVATALGAGLCALILYCVQVRYAVGDGAEKARARQDFAKLLRHDNMKVAIENIGMTSGKFVKVWEIFAKAVANAKDSHDRNIAEVAQVGKTLCMKL